MPSFESPADAHPHADNRRRWASAAIRSGALLILPLACWLLLPAPARVSVPPPPRVPRAYVAPPPAIVATPARLPPPPPPPTVAPQETAPAVAEAVEGEVQSPEGEPIEGATVTCTLGERELKAETDDAGAFRFEADAAGCRAVATASGFGASQPQVLRAGSGNRVRLSAPTGIAGHVVDEQGQPVVAYWIDVAAFQPAGGGQAGPGSLVTRRRQVDDPGGAFALTGLAPGRYELVASVRRGPMVRSAGIDVAAGAMTQGVTIVVHDGVTVAGMVTDATTGAPIDGARAFVLWGGLSTRQPLTHGGKFTLQNAPVGIFDLRVLAPGYALKIVPGLEGRPGGPPLQVDVALERDTAP